MSAMHRIRILLADDHPVTRLGVRELLSTQPDMEVVGEAGDGMEAVRLARELRPDVAVVDIAMPELNGLEATFRITELGLGCKVLVLTVQAQERYLFHVLQAGGLGYVLKTAAFTELVDAVRMVAQGRAYLRPDAARLLIGDYLERVSAGEEQHSYDSLSHRERQVLQLTAEGYTSQQIGDRLALSPNTVDTYRHRLMEKLGIQNRAELVRYALRKGLLIPPE